MKHVFFLLAMSVMATGALFAQSKKPPEPVTLNEINHYNMEKYSLDPLDKDKADFVTKAKGLGFGGAATNFVLHGEKASIRITQSDTISFIISLGTGMGDPSGWYSLFKAEVKQGKRVANYVKTKTYFGRSGSGDGIINFTVRRFDNQVYQIVPSKPLEKGEYFFVNRGTLGNYGGRGADAFAFGID